MSTLKRYIVTYYLITIEECAFSSFCLRRRSRRSYIILLSGISSILVQIHTQPFHVDQIGVYWHIICINTSSIIVYVHVHTLFFS